MRKMLLAGAGLALLAGGGVALAQIPPGPPPGGPGGPGGPGPHGPGPRGPGFGPHEQMEMRLMRMASRSAGFRFRRGDAEVDIKCAAEEPMQACVNAASVLIDKIAGLQPKTP